jgi:hypothetical protein
MELRYVEEPDPLRQALLEIYVAVVLRTPHNNFETHLVGRWGVGVERDANTIAKCLLLVP